MLYLNRVGFVMLILTIVVALGACGPSGKTVKKDYTVATDISGLEVDESQAPTLVYKRPGAPTLAVYNRFIIDPVQVNYTDPKMKELDPEQVGEMQQYFRDAMIKELRDGGYVVGTRSEAQTMRISLTISGLKVPSAAPNIVGVLAPFAISVGEVTVEGVFREALTNRIDAVVVARTQGSHVMKSKAWSTWADVKATFNKWAKGVRKAVDEAHARQKS